jgi:S-DNA-T family DNA segregation ATPase FtsK/SpoIIIE
VTEPDRYRWYPDDAGGDAGQDLVEVAVGDELDAETVPVEREQLAGPVDPPDEPATLYGTIVRSRQHERRPIVPAWLRNHDQRRQFAAWAVDYVWYLVRWHAWHSPKYLGKTLLWAPWGLLRTLGRVLRWAWAEEGNWALRQHAANRGDIDGWVKLDDRRRRSATWRWTVLLAGATAAAIGLAILAAFAPAWARWLALAAAVPLLAWAGRPADKPIIDRVSTGPKFVKLTAQMVRDALCVLGIPRITDPASIKFPTEIHRDGPGWLARVDLPGGVEAVKVLEKRGGLSSALRLPIDQIWPEAGPDHAGQVDLWVGYMPASKMGQPTWDLAKPNARTSFFEPAPFATDARQRPIFTTLFETNELVGGAPGSGKSYAARTLATIAMLDPTVELKIAEFKGTGDFLDVEHLCSTYTVGVLPENFEVGRAIVDWVLAECERRGRRILAAKKRGEAPLGKVTPELAARPGSGLHPVFILLDEVHELFLYDKEIAAAAERAIKRGRALGIHMVLATQIPDKDSIPPNITRCVQVRWCLSVAGQVENDMILGTGAYKRGLSATVYRPKFDAGWGILTGLERDGGARSFFPAPDTAKAIVARATELRGGRVVGTDELPARRDVLADVRRVFYAGEAFISWPQIAARLVEQMPDFYPEVTAEAVSAQLRALGVPSEDGRDKSAGGRVLKGAKVAAIDAAIQRRELEPSR